MKKFLTTSLSCLACFSAASLLAGPSLDERIDKLEKEMKDVHVKNVAGTTGAGFAKSSGTHCSSNWFISADILYWHAKSGGTDWVLVTDSTVYPFKGYLKDCGFDWDWGFRFGIGKIFNHDGWDLGLEYTRFHTADGSKVAVDFVTPASSPESPQGDPGTSGSSNVAFTCAIDYDNLDLNLGKSYFTSARLSLHPYAGLKSAWIKQKQRLYSTTSLDASQGFSPADGIVDTNLFARCNFWGIGPKFGTDLSWFLSNNFKFIGTVEAALLQGYFKVDQNQWVAVTPNGEPQDSTSVELTGNTRKFVPYARMLLGLGYGTYVREGKNYFDISLNYEVNYYWRVNQFITEEDSVPANINITQTQPVRLALSRQSEDLSFYGVTLKLRYQF